jgi:hypothetical protein
VADVVVGPGLEATWRDARRKRVRSRAWIWLFSSIGRCMQRHRYKESLRFLNTVEAAVTPVKLIHTIRFSLRRVRAEKKPSTAFIHEAEVGLKWKIQRGCRRSTAPSPSTTKRQSHSSEPSQPQPSSMLSTVTQPAPSQGGEEALDRVHP